MHAYLIIAHDKIEQLQLLLDCLDDERNDIYLHIDKKFGPIPTLSTRKARLFVLSKRLDVRWGDYSQVEAELLLIETALSGGFAYSYLHLLSGADLPIKTQDHIHSFCAKNAGKEFIGYHSTEETAETIRRAHRYHLFPKYFRSTNVILRSLRFAFLLFQDIFKLNRNSGTCFRKGAQWFSITSEMASFFLSQKHWLDKTFHHTFCPDELAIQTIAWNSTFKDRLYDIEDEYCGNMRCIKWHNGQLSDWTADDYQTLACSDALFARKFNLDDPTFIKRVLQLSSKVSQ